MSRLCQYFVHILFIFCPHLFIFCPYSGHILSIVWPYYGHILFILWPYFGHMLSIFYPFLRNPEASLARHASGPTPARAALPRCTRLASRAALPRFPCAPRGLTFADRTARFDSINRTVHIQTCHQSMIAPSPPLRFLKLTKRNALPYDSRPRQYSRPSAVRFQKNRYSPILAVSLDIPKYLNERGGFADSRGFPSSESIT